jgi:hypothetical protein
MTTESKAGNTAQNRVKQLIIDSGFVIKKSEKEFNFIERYLLSIKESDQQLEKSGNECAELLTGTIEQLQKSDLENTLLKEQIIAFEQAEENQQLNEKKTGSENQENEQKQEVTNTVQQEAIDLLMESAAGFSDGLHFRSYSFRVMKYIKSLEEV